MKQISQAIRNFREIKRTFDSWISSLLHLRLSTSPDFRDVIKCGYLDSIWPRNPLHIWGSKENTLAFLWGPPNFSKEVPFRNTATDQGN